MRYPQKCLKCGNEWSSTVEVPNWCPKCKSVNFDTPHGSGFNHIVRNVKEK